MLKQTCVSSYAWRCCQPSALSASSRTNVALSLRRLCIWVVWSALLIHWLSVVACTHPVRRLVFQPHKIEHVPALAENIPGLERFWLATEQGKVEGWILHSQTVTQQRPGMGVIIAHGNRELIDFYLERAEFYQDLGFTVLMGEYRGYGRSAGKPSREKIGRDAIRFFDILAALPGVDAQRILFHGRSLGGAVLAELAHHRRPAAIILESVFSSVKAMARGAPNFLLTDNYDTGAAMRAYNGPVLIIHGKRDEVVPVQHAHALKTQIPHARLALGYFGHSDGPTSVFDYWGRLMDFIEDIKILYP